MTTALVVAALFLFVMGLAGFAAMLKGCVVLRRIGRRKSDTEGKVLLKSPLVPAVSMIATPPDGSAQSREHVRRLLDLEFGKHEVVVVLDGRSETELADWTRDFHLAPSARISTPEVPSSGVVRGVYESRDPYRLVVLDKEPVGEANVRLADALNAGVNVAASPVIGLAGADCAFEATLLMNLIRPMLDNPERTIAVCGLTPLPPGSAGLIASLGAIESLRMWLVRGAAFAGWKMVAPVPGASLLVRRDAIVRTKGFRGSPLQLFLDLQGLARAGHKGSPVAFVAQSSSHARIPGSWEDLRRNVVEDQTQLAAALRNRGPRGLWAIGWGLPALFLSRWIRPALESAALVGAAAGWAMGWVGPWVTELVLLSTVGMGILVSMSAVAFRELASLEGSSPFLLAVRFFASIPENLGYRQLRNLWMIRGFFS